jgi:hypothetical protein
MSNGYVVLFIRGKGERDERTREILEDFKAHKIKYKIVDLNEKIELYGSEVTLEGAFALDFSGNGTVPTTPLAVADDRRFNGSEEIRKNLKFLRENYPDF